MAKRRIIMPPRKVATEEKVNTEEVKDVSAKRIHDNMRFYGKVQDTPLEAQKSFNNGRFSGTDINPMWRIKKLTEVFGPTGFGWWTQNINYIFQESPETKEIAVFCELELVVKDPETGEESHPIYGVGGNTFVASRKAGLQSSDEAMKMAYTDALSIACKALGFSHDIYYSKDKTKYTMEETPTDDMADEFVARITKGIAKLTANMSTEEKNKFAKEVIQKHIGTENYLACRDVGRLKSLLDALLEMAKKPA
jgi:hypothetical protein